MAIVSETKTSKHTTISHDFFFGHVDAEKALTKEIICAK